jgi:putative transposase
VLLQQEKYKNIIIDSLSFLLKDKRVIIYAFILMNNHVHFIWQIQKGFTKEAVQRDFLKFTAQQIKDDLEKNHPKVMLLFKVNAKDRKYQKWERNSLSVDLFSEKVFSQKLNYIHQNPVKAELCKFPEEYYSSAKFYETGIDDFGFLTHFRG